MDCKVAYVVIFMTIIVVNNAHLYKRKRGYGITMPHKYLTTKNAMSCAVECNGDQSCKVVSYEAGTKTCALGNDDSSPSLLTPRAGTMVYFAGKCDWTSGWFDLGGRCLLFVGTFRSWHDSQTHCQSLGGTLANPNNIADIANIGTVTTCTLGIAGCEPWLGLNDLAIEGQIVRSGGQTTTPEILALMATEFNNANYDCSYYYTPAGSIHLYPCHNADSSVCEKQYSD